MLLISADTQLIISSSINNNNNVLLNITFLNKQRRY